MTSLRLLRLNYAVTRRWNAKPFCWVQVGKFTSLRPVVPNYSRDANEFDKVKILALSFRRCFKPFAASFHLHNRLTLTTKSDARFTPQDRI